MSKLQSKRKASLAQVLQKMIVGCLFIPLLVLPNEQGVSAATIAQLVAKQRLVMEKEMDKKLNESMNSEKSSRSFGNRATEMGTGQSAKSAANELSVNAIYGINGVMSVDVSIGPGPFFPLTQGQEIAGWTIAALSASAVTLKHRKRGETKTIYFSAPMTDGSAHLIDEINQVSAQGVKDGAL